MGMKSSLGLDSSLSLFSLSAFSFYPLRVVAISSTFNHDHSRLISVCVTNELLATLSFLFIKFMTVLQSSNGNSTKNSSFLVDSWNITSYLMRLAATMHLRPSRLTTQAKSSNRCKSRISSRFRSFSFSVFPGAFYRTNIVPLHHCQSRSQVRVRFLKSHSLVFYSRKSKISLSLCFLLYLFSFLCLRRSSSHCHGQLRAHHPKSP